MNLLTKLEIEHQEQKQEREAKIKFTNNLVKKKTGKYLNDRKTEILRYSLPPEKLKYKEIADKTYCGENTVRDDASDLWKLLAEILERDVKKTSVNEAIKSAMEENFSAIPTLGKDFASVNSEDELPEGSIPLGSTYYVERVDPHHTTTTIESTCYQEILKPYALVKIKAPRLMGKTSLNSRIKSIAIEQQFKVVEINLRTFATRSTLKSLATFLQRFCCKLSHALNLSNNIEAYWDDSFLDENDICSDFLVDSILSLLDRPLLLILDEVNYLFPHEDIAVDFFALLRAWHEEGKHNPQWRKLRLVLAYSSEPFLKLPLGKSPFENVGTFINLPEFSVGQVANLANNRYSLELNSTDINSLMAIIGGHPYLIRKALYALSQKTHTVQQILEQATYTEGIYTEHLEGLLRSLKEVPDLISCYGDIVNSESWLEIDPLQARDLYSLGLVKRKEGKVKASLNLYRQYFKRVLAA